MKKIKFILIIFTIFLLTGCSNKDNILFKEEYESLNTDSNYRSVSIPEDNPFVYITDAELVKKIENKEDMVVYFGFNKCPWCRSVIETFIEVSNDLNIDKIYYLDILDIRDTKELVDGEIITSKEGSDSYYKLLDLLNDYLDDYVIEDQVVSKRIYAPNILVIKNSEIIGIVTGESDLLTNPFDELTDEVKKDSYDKIYSLLSKYNNLTCNSSHGC